MAFAKGQSGNPQGRRREKPFADALRMELAAAGADHKALRGIAAQLIQAALKGKMDAIKEIADRMDGKPAQQINHADETGEGPARFIVTGVPRAGD